jgi:hypothetical protein
VKSHSVEADKDLSGKSNQVKAKTKSRIFTAKQKLKVLEDVAALPDSMEAKLNAAHP